MPPQISGQRKTAFYVGTGMMAVGLLLFLSIFVTFAASFGDTTDFHGQMRSEMLRGMIGMGLMMLGGVIRGVGARGLAGAGLLLDPERAREELKPHSRMVGGVVRDVLDEAEVATGAAPTTVVRVRCRACGQLSAEEAKFCQACGKPL